jgi:hypothetical protein
VLIAACGSSSCLDPTEIVLEIGTDVACSVVAQNGVAITVGRTGDDGGVAIMTNLCASDGGIGSLAITPSGAVDDPIGIRVVLGVDASVDACGPNYEGCIVARRALRFDPHTPLTLPIDLDQACIGVPCTPDSTCVSGSCVDASIGPCTGVCNVEDAGPPDVIDAGPFVPTSILMYGGSTDCSGQTPVPLVQDAWSWKGGAWTPAPIGPPVRYLQAMGALGGETMLFGGFGPSNTFLGDSWAESGGTWTQQNGTAPAGRAFAATATLGNRVILYGGDASNATQGDTWAWDGTSWKDLAIPGPYQRAASAMAAIDTNIVLFGGTTNVFGGNDLSDTWIFDGTSWTPKSVTSPPARDGHVMATLGKRVVLFGGEFFSSTSTYVPLGDTWIWDGMSWSPGPPKGPSARYYASMAELGGKLYLFGGTNGSGALADLWQFDGTAWTPIPSSANGPTMRCGQVMVPQ